MTELKEDKRPETPKDQVARQAAQDARGVGEDPPEPGEPHFYSPPMNPNAGVVKSPPNEVKPDQWDADGNPIPKDSDVEPTYVVGESGTPAERSAHTTKAADEDYEEKTVPELRELAAERGVQVRADANKADIIRALKKGS